MPSVPAWRQLPPSDGVVLSKSGAKATVRLLDEEHPSNRLLIAGCDPAMSVLARHVRLVHAEMQDRCFVRAEISRDNGAAIRLCDCPANDFERRRDALHPPGAGHGGRAPDRVDLVPSWPDGGRLRFRRLLLQPGEYARKFVPERVERRKLRQLVREHLLPVSAQRAVLIRSV